MNVVWIVNIVSVFVICGLVANAVIARVLLIAIRKGLYDEPNRRSVHSVEVPRLGGVSFYPVVLFTVILLLAVNTALGYYDVYRAICLEIRPLAWASCAVFVLYLVGIKDDLVGVRYRTKIAAQALAGAMMVAGGVVISDLGGLFFLRSIPFWLGAALTIFAVLFITNAWNLIDGIDGLATALGGVALVIYGVVFSLAGKWIYAVLAFAVLGVLAAFFRYNVFGTFKHKRKIFMGDTGSLTLGFILCFLSVKLSGLEAESIPCGASPFAVAFAPLLVPCLDMCRVYLYRVIRHGSPFHADKNHIHHKMLALGLSQRQVRMALVVISILITFTNILLSYHVGLTILFVADILVWMALNMYINRKTI